MNLEQRMARLENRNRMLGIGLVLAFVGMGVLSMRPTAPAARQDPPATVKAPPSQEVSVRSLTLVDERGEARAVLGIDSDEEPTLVFVNAEGVQRAAFGILDGGTAGFELGDDAGQKWVDMAAYAGGAATLKLENKKAKTSIYLGVWDNDVTRFSFGRNEKAVLDICDDEDGLTTPWGD